MPEAVPLEERPRSAQILLACVIPFVFGAVVGVALGISAGLYWGLSALAALGALVAGREHPGGRGAVPRGVVGGALFATGILLAHLVTGAEEKVSLGNVPVLLILIDAILGAIFTAIGARILGARPIDERTHP